jgi:YgiT-type zinc finger domain-containing protein|uniref:type II toxin-antitoxin system MqsA family antitoxin n=1 Tax=uncultured Ruminococcus sp. TaxID=165186 RepID=UPI0025D8F656|nr:type II toxin-antitoxin system MqsA family antitoxin [uncultured Ruminococcus sp.]
MTCFYCKGNMIDSTTTYVEDLGNCIVIIRNVPCSKCSQCGEVSYNGTVLRQIEHIIDNLKNSLTEVAIVNYKPSVA